MLSSPVFSAGGLITAYKALEAGLLIVASRLQCKGMLHIYVGGKLGILAWKLS